MKFQVVDQIAYSRDLVFPTYRDRLLEFVEYLPNVDEVDIRSRADDGDVVSFENWWTGTSDDVPRVLRGLLKPDMLVWIDRAKWDEGAYRCDWRITLRALPDAVTAKGYNLFFDEDDQTIIQINGEFIVHPDKLRGVPSFVARKAAPTVEKFVVGLLEPNLRQSNRAVEQYLDDNE